MATGVSISVEGQKYSLDDFELGDLEWLEDFLGQPLMTEGSFASMKAMVGFVYLIKRREDPAFTLEQARHVKLTAVEPSEDGEPESEPEPAQRPTKKAKASGT